MKVKLNLGCGDKLLPGFINVDTATSRKGVQPDVVCDIRNLSVFKSNCADQILAVHVIEHFYHWEVHPLLEEWKRVLKPDGQIILECPNLLSACQVILSNPEAAASPGLDGRMSMWPLFGDPQWQDPLMCHRWAYTPQSLQRVLEQAGFTAVRQEPAQYKLREPRDMRITGRKPSANSFKSRS
jgi:ubiquinone/menaquinone biosynthesis C-methylase UbiE